MAALALSLHLIFNHGLRKLTTSKFGSMNKVMSGQVNADIIINGSSRALSHYDPRVLQRITGHSAYNIGMNASQIDFQLAMLKAYLKHNAKPAMVIQNLDLFSFETTKKGEIYDPASLVPYLYDNELYEPLHKIDPVVWKWKHIPLYGYAVEDMRFSWIWATLGCFGVNAREDYFEGFNPRNAVWNQDFENFKSHYTEGVKFRVEPAGVEAMEQVIQYCEAKDIRVVLVCSPEYSEMQAMELNRQEIVARFQEIATRFHAPLWDYSNSEICHWPAGLVSKFPASQCCRSCGLFRRSGPPARFGLFHRRCSRRPRELGSFL